MECLYLLQNHRHLPHASWITYLRDATFFYTTKLVTLFLKHHTSLLSLLMKFDQSCFSLRSILFPLLPFLLSSINTSIFPSYHIITSYVYPHSLQHCAAHVQAIASTFTIWHASNPLLPVLPSAGKPRQLEEPHFGAAAVIFFNHNTSWLSGNRCFMF